MTLGSLKTRSIPMSTAKKEARQLLERIPDDATWEDIRHEFYVEKKVEQGLRDLEAGEALPHEDVKKRCPLGTRRKIS